MGPLKEVLETKFPWLFDELGFRVVSHSYSPAQFGDSEVVLESPTLRLRFRRDRGEVRLEIAAPGETKWWEFKFVWEAIFHEFPEPALEGYGPLIRSSYSAIAEALGPSLPKTLAMLEQQEAERKVQVKEFLNRQHEQLRSSRYAGLRPPRARVITNIVIGIFAALFLWFILFAHPSH